MTREQIAAVLESIRSWPESDQEELAEVAREIEARRTGNYPLNAEERAAVENALKSPVVPDDEVVAFWKTRGIA